MLVKITKETTKRVAFTADFPRKIKTEVTRSKIYTSVTDQPCHVAGVHPQPYNFLLNQ